MLEVYIPTWPDLIKLQYLLPSLISKTTLCMSTNGSGKSKPWDGGGSSRTLDKGGPVPPKKIFCALWASVWSKNKRGHRVPSPRSATEYPFYYKTIILQVVSWHQITCDISVIIIVLYFLPSPSFSISSRKPLLSSISWRTTWRNNQNKYYFWFNFYFYK